MGSEPPPPPPPPPPLKNHKNIEFLSNTGPDPLKNHKATKSAFNVGHHRSASETPFKWWWPAYSGIWILPPLIKLKKKLCQIGPLWQNFLDPGMSAVAQLVECYGLLYSSSLTTKVTVSLSKTHYPLLSTDSTQENRPDLTVKLLSET